MHVYFSLQNETDSSSVRKLQRLQWRILFVLDQTVRANSAIFNLLSRVQRIFEPSSCSSRHFNLIYSSQPLVYVENKKLVAPFIVVAKHCANFAVSAKNQSSNHQQIGDDRDKIVEGCCSQSPTELQFKDELGRSTRQISLWIKFLRNNALS